MLNFYLQTNLLKLIFIPELKQELCTSNRKKNRKHRTAPDPEETMSVDAFLEMQAELLKQKSVLINLSRLRTELEWKRSIKIDFTFKNHLIEDRHLGQRDLNLVKSKFTCRAKGQVPTEINTLIV